MPPDTLHIRPAETADEPFFAELYRTTRDDLLALPADPSFLDTLVAMQQRMQAAGYRASYPRARYQVIESCGQAVGRVVTATLDGAEQAARVASVVRVVRVVDIAILPRARGRGVAREVLRRIQDEASRAGADVALAVRRDNVAACRLYAALGFTVEDEDAVSLQLRWRPRDDGVAWPASMRATPRSRPQHRRGCA